MSQTAPHSPAHPPVPESLSGRSARTYEKVFAHPLSHDLEAEAVRHLLRELGHDVKDDDRRVIARYSSHTLALHVAPDKTPLPTDALMVLRHYLQATAAKSDPTPAGDCCLVIDHHEARILSLDGSHAQPQRIVARSTKAQEAETHGERNFHLGKEKTDPKAYFQATATAVRSAHRVVLLGNGKGTASEMELFAAWLEHHEPAVAAKIAGKLVVDEHHLTDGELVTKARNHLAHLSPTAPRV